MDPSSVFSAKHVEYEPDRIHGSRLDLASVVDRNRADWRFALHSKPLSLVDVYLAISDLRRFSHFTCGDSVSEDTLVRWLSGGECQSVGL